MRTTLNLDDDVLRAARALADEEGCSLDRIVSELMRRGLASTTERRVAFPVFPVKEGTLALTPDMVKRALDRD